MIALIRLKRVYEQKEENTVVKDLPESDTVGKGIYTEARFQLIHLVV